MSAPFEVNLDVLEGMEEGERREWMAKLARFKREIEANPLWAYIPHDGEGTGGQVAFHQASADDTFCAAAVAGNRFGKTHSGAVDCLIQTLPDQFLPPWLQPYRRRPYTGDYRCRVVVVDLPNALTKVMLPKLRKLVPAKALWKGSFKDAWNERSRMLTFADGSWWDFLTHDMDVDAFAGADLDRIWFDEEPPGAKGRLQYDESLTRLIDRDGDVRFTLTPLLGLNWVYYELTADGHPRDDEECRVVTGSMAHNPHISKVMQARLQKRWAKEPLTLQARMHGAFVHFAGQIYPEFDEARHVVPAQPIPKNTPDGATLEMVKKVKPMVPIYASIDPGIDHPTGVCFAWLDSEDVLEVFHSFKVKGTVAEVATLYDAACDELGFRPRWTTIDPSARNKSHITGRSTQWEYAQHGIHTIPGQNSRAAGYNAVKERLMTDRLVIHAGNEELVDEFRKYRWKPNKGISEDAPKEEPIKVNDDILDALRYLVMSMPAKARSEPQDDNLSGPMRAHRDFLARRKRSPKLRRVGMLRP